MITLGLDPHPDSHTLAALDANRALHGTITMPNDQNGLAQLLEWSHAFPERRWALEGANHRFKAELLARLSVMNEPVFNISPNLTCQYRARRGPKRNDVIDAQNVARDLIANPNLPAHRLIEQRTILERVSRLLSAQVKRFEGEIRRIVQVLARALLEVRGVGMVMAGGLLAGTGDTHRFASAHHFASCAGARRSSRGAVGTGCR